MSDVKCHKCGDIYSCDMQEEQGLCPKCKTLRCSCGMTLEDGGFCTLWCPKCKDKWTIPEGMEEDKRYYFKIQHIKNTP